MDISTARMYVGALGGPWGSAELFAFNGTRWEREQPCLSVCDHNDVRFGISVALGEDRFLVGARALEDPPFHPGKAYFYEQDHGGCWVHRARLTPNDPENGDRFGQSVALAEELLIVDALHHTHSRGFESAGAVYTFLSNCPRECVRDPEWQCDGDVDGDGQVNPVDVGSIQAAFGSECEVDLCNYDMDCDGQINPVDAGIVQSLFGTCDPPRDVCP